MKYGKFMSRIGKQPIEIPEKTEVTVSEDAVLVKGPLGELSRQLHPEVSVSVEEGAVVVAPRNKTLFAQALWGTYASHVINMMQGVNRPFEKKLLVQGIGYKSDLSGNKIVLAVGFSHKVELDIPESLTVTTEKNVITVSGADKELVGQFAAKIRAVKKPEPYKGKGIRYEDEQVRQKQGKKSV